MSGVKRKCVGVLFALLIASATCSRTASASTPMDTDVRPCSESHIDVSPWDSSRIKSSSSSSSPSSSSQSTTRLFQELVISSTFKGASVGMGCPSGESRLRSKGSISCWASGEAVADKFGEGAKNTLRRGDKIRVA